MSPRKDITGLRFGRLRVISFSHINKHGAAHWHCHCDCGKNKPIVGGAALQSGHTKSCGCLKRELASARLAAKHGHSHIGNQSPEYICWANCKRVTKLLPTQKYLLECFVYERSTGALTWKRRPQDHFVSKMTCRAWNAKYAGKPAGRLHKGYCDIRIGDTDYRAHRIIWKLMTGEEPPETIDHKDRDRANNSWNQLRPASHTQQKWNTILRKDNKSGRRGVSWHALRGKWQVHIANQYIGLFDTVKEAGDIADNIRRQLAGKFYTSPS